MAYRIKPIKGPTLIPARPKRIVNEAHLGFIRTLPCCATGQQEGVIAHHIRIGHYQGGRKPGDHLAVPLETNLHQGCPWSLHSMNEGAFWNKTGIDIFALAAALYAHTGNYERCIAELEMATASARIRRAHGIALYSEKSVDYAPSPDEER